MIAAMPVPPPASRRAVLLGGLGTLALGGCGIRLESDAPALPGVPTRTPRPGEDALIALLKTGRQVEALATSWTGGADARRWAVALAAVVRAQDETLARVLAAAGAPNPSASATPSTGVAPSARAGGPLPSAPALATLLSDAATQTAGAALVEADLRPTLVAVLASRAAWTATLGRPYPLAAADAATPHPAWPSGLVPWVLATRAARYALQVVAARSDGAQRTTALLGLEQLGTLEREQLAVAGTATPPEAVGYALPFPVTDAASAARLARHAATGLRTTYASALDGLPAGEPAFADAARWLGRAEALVLQWGGPAEPFPGLSA